MNAKECLEAIRRDAEERAKFIAWARGANQ